jgi:hypothetical protein
VAHGFQDSLTEHWNVSNICGIDRQDSKFVPTKPGDRIAFAN